MSYGYRVQNEYTSFPFLTRIAGTYSFLVTCGIVFGKISPVRIDLLFKIGLHLLGVGVYFYG